MTYNHTGHNQMSPHHAVPFVFCILVSCRRFISILVTDRLDSFMNRQFVFWYTGSLRSFVVALVAVISNLFIHGQFMMKKTQHCLEIYAAMVTNKFKSLMLSSHCIVGIQPAGRNRCLNQMLKEGLNSRFISELVRELQYWSNSDLHQAMSSDSLISTSSSTLESTSQSGS